MSAILPGYNYDIFISYRQKDNKHDGWVTEFVNNLKDELESTFKEEISLYFDINPHDGLLETHDVDASLKEKLKCLIFIPIVSRTYCDPKSFAWEHEFKAFVEIASKDHYGLKVKLPNGNVAGRVLPVIIHDLELNDIKVCESVLGAVLRGVDFIYKEPGIDKPLSIDDDEKRNLNKTKYKIQIVKVAHAIKEIVLGIKNASPEIKKPEFNSKTEFPLIQKTKKKDIVGHSGRLKLLIAIVSAAILIIIASILIPGFIRDPLESIRSSGRRISVAVMPFQNLTNDTVWNIWQRAVQEELATYLANYSDELQLRGTQSINSLIKSQELNGPVMNLSPRIISRKLDADVFISGSIKQAGNELRLNAELYDSKRNEPYKSFELRGYPQQSGILRLIDSLKIVVVNTLIISKLKNELEVSRAINHEFTESSEAFRYFFYGINAFNKKDWVSTQNWMTRALKVDSNLYEASIFISFAYSNQGLFEEGKKWCMQLYNKREKMPSLIRAKANSLHSELFETPDEQIRCYRQELIFDEKDPVLYWEIGTCLNDLMEYENAITEFRKSLDLFDERKLKPVWVYCYTELGYAYHMTGRYKLEKKIYNKAERDFPHDTDLVRQEAVLSFALGDTVSGTDYINQYKSLCMISGTPEAAISSTIAKIYSAANIVDLAEQYYKNALSMEPGSPERMNRLAYFLIDKDVDVYEGLEIIDKALRVNPANYSYLHTKGWGLFKLGKYQDALDLLQTSWDLRIKNAIYDHQAYLHLEAAKKAAGKTTNKAVVEEGGNRYPVIGNRSTQNPAPQPALKLRLASST